MANVETHHRPHWENRAAGGELWVRKEIPGEGFGIHTNYIFRLDSKTGDTRARNGKVSTNEKTVLPIGYQKGWGQKKKGKQSEIKFTIRKNGGERL